MPNHPPKNPMLTQDEKIKINHLSIVFCSFLAKSVALITLLLAVVCSFRTFTIGFAVSPILPCITLLCVSQLRKICVSADKQTGVDKIRPTDKIRPYVFSHPEYFRYDHLVKGQRHIGLH